MPSVNVTSGVKEDRMMITGMHTVSDHRNGYMITGMHTHDYIVNLELTHWNKILFKAGTRCRALMEANTGLHQMLTWAEATPMMYEVQFNKLKPVVHPL